MTKAVKLLSCLAVFTFHQTGENMDKIPDSLEDLFGCTDVASTLNNLQERSISIRSLACVYVTTDGTIRLACTELSCAELVGFLEKAKADVLAFWMDADDVDGEEEEDGDEGPNTKDGKDGDNNEDPD